MKLNPDCIRDILISVELNTDARTHFLYPEEIDKCPNLSNYSDNEIRYHISQCAMSNLILSRNEDLAGNIRIIDLTPSGHEFLANMRSDTVWSKTKNIAHEIGVTSLTALKDVSTAVLTEIIKASLHLN